MSLKKRVSYIGLGKLFNTAANILMVPYLARAMSVNEYGTYGQVLMVLGIAQVLFSLGIPKLIFRSLNKDELKADDSVFNLIVLALMMAVGGSILLIVCSGLITDFLGNENLYELLILYSLSLIFNVLSDIITSILTHFRRERSIAISAIINNSIRIIVIFISVQFYRDLHILFICLLIVSLINFLILLSYNPASYFKGKLNLRLIKRYLIKGLPLSLSGISTVLLVQTDGVMISSMLNTSDYAVYRMGAVPIPFLFLIYSSVITITIVEVNKLFFQNEISSLVSLKRKASYYIGLMSFPTLVFFIVFSKEFVYYYLGEQYLASQNVFVIYNLLLFLRINDYRDVLIASERTMTILYIDLSMLLLNIVANYYFISLIGIEGAAIASIASYYLLSGTLQWVTSNQLKIRFLAMFNVKALTSIFLVSFVCAFLIRELYLLIQNLYLLVLTSISYIVIVYLILIKLKIFNVQEFISFSKEIKYLKPAHRLLSFLK